MKLLLAEDDPLLGRATCKALSQLGHVVDWLSTGQRVLSAVETYTYDCILLDLGLPDVSGEQCLRAIRSTSRTIPVIVLTAREASGAKIEMFEKGADDYLVKPYDIDELEARIRAVVRRVAGHRGSEGVELVHESLRVNPATRSVVLGKVPLKLTNKEFWLLESLMRSGGRIVTRRSLEESLYGWEDDCSSNSIEVFVFQLRRKLGPGIIHTVRGVGYRLSSIEDADKTEVSARDLA
jgi:DNA-binding response OmpR family regulator